MKTLFAVTPWLLGISILSQPALAQKPAQSPVSQALEQEMKRAFELLKQKGNPAPYFLSYSVRENQSVDIEAALGALHGQPDQDHSRLLDIDIRVGNYDLDNTHQIRGQRGANTGPAFSYPVLMPIDNDVDALRSVIWLETDRRYKTAVERLIQVRDKPQHQSRGRRHIGGHVPPNGRDSGPADCDDRRQRTELGKEAQNAVRPV